MKEGAWGAAREGLKVADKMGLVSEASVGGNAGEALASVPKAADMLQTREAREHFGAGTGKCAYMPFEHALAHGGSACDFCDGKPSRRIADHVDCRLDGQGRRALRAQALKEEILENGDLGEKTAGIGKLVLHALQGLSWYERVEGEGSTEEQIRSVVENGRCPNFGESDDDDRRVGRVLGDACLSLQAGNDRVGETLVAHRNGAGLAENESHCGFREEQLAASLGGFDPEDFAHVGAQQRGRLVNEMANRRQRNLDDASGRSTQQSGM
jgi:hypothetical protein